MREEGVPKWKQDKVKELAELIKKYKVVGVVNMERMPSRQLVLMKRKLGEDAIIRMARRSIEERALKNAKIESLLEYLKGQPALILSDIDTFKLSKLLRDSRTSAPAKEGSVLEKDITVPSGETSFTPGPIVGELGAMGVKAAIESGRVVIKEDSLLVKAGEKINKQKADLMAKLGIEPMEIGLNLVAAYENGLVYAGDVLEIDTETVLADMQTAYSNCMNLTVSIGYPTNDNIELFVQKAFRQAKSLATEANYTCKATVGDLLKKASAQATALKAKIPEKAEEVKAEEEKPSEEKEEEKAEEKPKEEAKKEEAPAEEKKEEPKEEAKPEEKTEEKPVEEKAPEKAKPEEKKTEKKPEKKKVEKSKKK